MEIEAWNFGAAWAAPTGLRDLGAGFPDEGVFGRLTGVVPKLTASGLCVPAAVPGWCLGYGGQDFLWVGRELASAGRSRSPGYTDWTLGPPLSWPRLVLRTSCLTTR